MQSQKIVFAGLRSIRPDGDSLALTVPRDGLEELGLDPDAIAESSPSPSVRVVIEEGDESGEMRVYLDGLEEISSSSASD